MRTVCHIIRKKLLPAAALLLLAGLLCACNAPAENQTAARLTIVTDIFPAYDWARAVIGDEPGVDLVLLGDNGADLHSYQPTVADFARLADCDLFIFVGGESDQWAIDALDETAAGALPLNLLELLGDQAKEEQPLPGLAAHDDHDHDEADEPEQDEHVWLSLTNAGVCTNAIAEAMSQLDGDHAAAYRKNAAAYQAELTALDDAYRAALSGARFNTILVADRFPFLYLTEDYDLQWYAAYPGCSAETGASFETIVFLTDKLAELRLPAVLTTEKADKRLAQTIVDTAGEPELPILELNSLQSVTSAEIAAGLNYLDAMRDNLATLTAALN